MPSQLEQQLASMITYAVDSPGFRRQVFWDWLANRVPADELVSYQADNFGNVLTLWRDQFIGELIGQYAEKASKDDDDFFFQLTWTLLLDTGEPAPNGR
jgi:hypothetical protein